MEQSQAKRTIVKSPPELWAELSSEDSLGRHLAEFGEIRITRLKPETTVAWEGDRASGTVQIEPTGWGTKVTLTAEPAVAEAVAEAPEAVAEAPQPVAEPEPAVQPEPVAEPAAVAQSEPASSVTRISLREVETPGRSAGGDDPVPRGFFTRFFRRPAATQAPAPARTAVTASIPTPPAPTPDPSPPAPGPDPTPPGPDPAPPPPPAPDPTPPPAPDPTPPPTIELPQSAKLDPERTTAILSEVLDDLGAAHHRPFSRG